MFISSMLTAASSASTRAKMARTITLSPSATRRVAAWSEYYINPDVKYAMQVVENNTLALIIRLTDNLPSMCTSFYLMLEPTSHQFSSDDNIVFPEANATLAVTLCECAVQTYHFNSNALPCADRFVSENILYDFKTIV
jgi:hypothetical protein